MPMPTPATTRAANNCQYSGATAQPIEEAKKRTADTIKTGFRPKRSPACARHRSPADATKQGRRGKEALRQVVEAILLLDKFHRAGNHGRIKTKKQAADRGH